MIDLTQFKEHEVTLQTLILLELYTHTYDRLDSAQRTRGRIVDLDIIRVVYVYI
jgi:uncharacterized membrane protein (DUF373 family)